MAVSAQQSAVKADVGGVEGGDRLDLGGDEVSLGDAVLLVENLHHRQLHPAVALVVLQGAAAHHQVQALGGNGLAQGLLGLVRTQVGQQIVDGELRIAGVAAHGHIHHRAVLEHHHAPQLQGDGHPLVLADAAIVVGLEEGDLAVLIEGGGLQVQTGGVDVGSHNGHALVQGGRADDSQVDAAAPVDPVDLHAGNQLHTPLQGHKTGSFNELRGVVHTGALGLALIQVDLVALAVIKNGVLGGLVHLVPAVLLLVEQLLPEQLSLVVLFHGYNLLYVYLCNIWANNAVACCSSCPGSSPSLCKVYWQWVSKNSAGF